MQKWRVNKFNLSKHSKRAFKRAMSWYNKEVQTKGKDGLSSYEVAKRVKVNLVVLVHLPEPFNDMSTVALQDYRH
jgi:hypothetical protein